jgi:hypothetical protein
VYRRFYEEDHEAYPKFKKEKDWADWELDLHDRHS